MSILYLLVPVAIGIVLIALAGFLWATKQGQFDDLETPALRAIKDDSTRPSVTRPSP
jgi:cbb3-type cytochrome oxidase maturation protein